MEVAGFQQIHNALADVVIVLDDQDFFQGSVVYLMWWHQVKKVNAKFRTFTQPA